MAMKKIMGLVFGLMITANVAATDIELNPAHPDRYVVVKGDTLWDISARFLKTPWRWPDIWQANEQIANPHLIYPGDVIELSFVDGQPRLTLNRGNGKLSPSIRKSSLDAAIPMIPIGAVAPFLTNPRVMTQEEYNGAPYIVAFSDEHILGSAGIKAYVRSIESGSAAAYSIVRQGEEYKDAETGESLGFESVFIADSSVETTGDPATVMLSKSTREATKGDRLLATLEGDIVQNFYPHEPASDLKGHIIGVVDGVNQIGQYNVVVVDRGLKDGVEIGHVFKVFHAGEIIRDVILGRDEKVTLPNEEAGTLMIFRAFDRVSYALVMEAKRVMHRLDVIQAP